MDYRILGPLELSDGTAPLALPGARQRGLLALLLLHRNEVVSSERLIDQLWGEAPPATAGKALQNAVSQVRRALSNGADPAAGPLRTERGGYILEVAPGELDADRFELALRDGRAALGSGDHAVAGERLREALAMWRGPPLADLAYEAFAQPEIARLEEERLGALEDRIEADLALGQHAALVAELEAEVARHPLRERLRAQLMTALYGSGRQADALEAFHDARRALLDELGIEPGPALRELNEAILRQDPSLRPPTRALGRSAPRSRLPVLAGAAAAVLLAAAVAAAVLASRDDEPATARITRVPGNSLVAIDLRSGDITGSYSAGSTPTSIAVGAGATWALNADDGTLTRVDTRTSAPRTFAVPDTALDLEAGPSGVWALTGAREGGEGDAIPRHVLELAPDTGAPVRALDLPGGDEVGWFALDRLALGPAALWAIGADDHLLRIDPRGGAVEVVPGLEVSGVAAVGDDAWVLTEDRRSKVVARVSEAGRVTSRVPVVSTELDGLAAGAGAVWVTAPQDGLLWRITPDSSESIDVGAGARGVAVGGGSVWVANAARGTVSRIDPRSNDVTKVVRVGNAPRALASDGRRLWVTVAAGAGTPAVDAARAASGAVTAPACGGVIASADTPTPERLIVSDLPLRQAAIGTIPDAIAFVLRRHDFRAGRFTVGYQSCDDSTAKQGTFEPEKCRANAGLYASTPRVVGIIGPYHSICALEQLATTNRAPGGPLATISPTNTLSELTIPVPGAREVARHYPTGRRHYVRLMGANDGEGGALAQFARDQGIDRLAIVHDDDGYGRTIALHAGRAARRLGVDVAGPYRVRLTWGGPRARALARRIAGDRPDGLLYAGVPDWGPLQKEKPGFALVREVRRRLGNDMPVLGPDSWSIGPAVHEALGRWARNIHLSVPGFPLERLGPAGRRFVADFRETRPGGLVTSDAVYFAQATELLLAAIARSDGSRSSVTRQLLATDVEDGLIGDVRFDANGDIRPRPYSIARVTPRSGTVHGVLPIADLEAIIAPP